MDVEGCHSSLWWRGGGKARAEVMVERARIVVVKVCIVAAIVGGEGKCVETGLAEMSADQRQ